MAKNKGKLKKKDEELIDQDEVIYEEEEIQEGGKEADSRPFYEKYRNFILIGVVGIAAIVLFFVVRGNRRAEANVQAQVDMIMPSLYYEQDSMNLAINGDGQSPGFSMLEGDYDGTVSGNLIKYYLGTAYLKLGQIDQGISYLEDFDKDDNMVAAAAYAALGYAYEQQQNFASAAENYESASRTPEENDFTTPFYLMHAARNHESAGNIEAAVAAYKKIRDQYPTSEPMVNGDVEKYIAKLSPADMNG